jgi:serine/threonine protein kinase
MKIDREQWGRLSALLDAALEIDASERDAWLQELPSDASALKDPLRTLLAQRARIETGEFLKAPDFASALRLETVRVHAAPLDLRAGSEVGAYRLLRELGRGGMGSVWLGERIDGRLKRQVALKFPYAGPHQRQLAERLGRERDILASLEHPNIARLYDADITGLGQPFLVLEYVDGIPVDAYCNRQRFTIRERLALFLQVLNAVQYAHAHLVIHRDLKPSNILINRDGNVQLLDFGIAKLISAGEDNESALTQLGGRALTPDYASPEQITGGAITTASDLYSLGVILYELLSGSRPYRLRRDSRASLEEAIAEVNLISPSRAAGNADVAVTAARSMTARQLARSLQGDLETIVLKALQKDPAARYVTVAALADDLQRFAADRPIQAQRESGWYRARKFVVRNRFAVAGASAAALLLLLAALLSLWQAREAREQAVVAQREAQRAQAVQNFLINLFRANTDAQVDPLKARNLTARELLDLGASRVKDELRGAPQAQDAVLITLADMYRAVGDDDAVAGINQQRVELRRKMYGQQHPLVADALIDLARSLQSTSKRLQVRELLEQAKAIADVRADTPDDVRVELLVELARVDMYTNVTRMRDYALQAVQLMQRPGVAHDELSPALRLAARANYWLGDWERARVLFEQALAEVRREALASPDLIVTELLELSEVYARQADVENAERLLREAHDLSLQRNGASHVDTIHVETRLAGFLHDTGRRGEAHRLMASALQNIEASTDHTPNVIGQVQRSNASNLFNEGQLEASARWSASDLELRRRLYPNSTTLASALYAEGRLQVELGHFESAAALLDEGSEVYRAGLGDAAEPVTRNRFLLLQAHLAVARGDARTALEYLQRIAPAKDLAALKLPLDAMSADITRSAALLQLNQDKDAQAAARAALETLQRSPLRRYYPVFEADALLQLGRAQLRSGEAAAARGALERALALRSAEDHANSPWIAEAQIALAECLFALGDSRATRLLSQATAIQAAHPELGAHFTQPLVDLRRAAHRAVAKQ